MKLFRVTRLANTIILLRIAITILWHVYIDGNVNCNHAVHTQWVRFRAVGWLLSLPLQFSSLSAVLSQLSPGESCCKTLSCLLPLRHRWREMAATLTACEVNTEESLSFRHEITCSRESIVQPESNHISDVQPNWQTLLALLQMCVCDWACQSNTHLCVCVCCKCAVC